MFSEVIASLEINQVLGNDPITFVLDMGSAQVDDRFLKDKIVELHFDECVLSGNPSVYDVYIKPVSFENELNECHAGVLGFYGTDNEILSTQELMVSGHRVIMDISDSFTNLWAKKQNLKKGLLLTLRPRRFMSPNSSIKLGLISLRLFQKPR